ncbi:MAG: hypothetical protein U1A73_23355 [Pseudomonas sp.]|nr:hypothetical protein [Pseudomonas sp.]
MTYPRNQLVPPGSPGTYHCVSRCVRRAFLCGEDRYSGQSFEHRRQWVEDRMQQLSEVLTLQRSSISARHGFWCPNAQGAVRCGEFEVVVGAQQRQIVSNAKLSEQRVDCANLNTRSTAGIAKIGGCNMVVAIRLQQRKRREVLDDLVARLRPGESLQQFLQNQPGDDDDISAQEGVPEVMNFRFSG